jgi:cation transport ATPase
VQVSLARVVPADLQIIAGKLLLDQSMLTGESIPAEAQPVKFVYAGALMRRGEATGRASPRPTAPSPMPCRWSQGGPMRRSFWSMCKS